jgi:recombination protein RecR
MELPLKLQNVVDQFTKLPGVGGKTALRQSMMLTKWNARELQFFASSLNELSTLKQCAECLILCDHEFCTLCTNVKRQEKKLLCVVENMTDCLAIENSGQFHGLYHVLGGVLNPLLGIGPDELNIQKLVNRVAEKFTEVILAINPSVEGDATCSYIKELLPTSIDVRRIGFGVPIGGHLEYLDAMTISKAFENSRSM